jgi:thymidylate synthase
MMYPGNSFATPAEAWHAMMLEIDRFGNNVITEDHQLTRELRNLTVTIEKPLQGFPIKSSGWEMPALEKYAQQFLDPSRAGFDYTYGERINDKSQLENVIRKLAEEKSSRRAVIKTWKPCRDYFQRHVPCLQLLDFLVRGNKLHMTAVFRSHDIGRAYVSNVYGLGKLMEHVAQIIDVDVGSLTTVSISAHIYQE